MESIVYLQDVLSTVDTPRILQTIIIQESPDINSALAIMETCQHSGQLEQRGCVVAGVSQRFPYNSVPLPLGHITSLFLTHADGSAVTPPSSQDQKNYAQEAAKDQAGNLRQGPDLRNRWWRSRRIAYGAQKQVMSKSVYYVPGLPGTS